MEIRFAVSNIRDIIDNDTGNLSAPPVLVCIDHARTGGAQAGRAAIVSAARLLLLLPWKLGLLSAT